jgi:anti-sigma B factor antagonist
MSESIRILEPQDMFDATGGGRVHAEVLALLETGTESILIDLKNITFMDSLGLRMMVTIQQLTRDKGTKLYFCSLQDQVRIVLELSKMEKFFDILPDRLAFNLL